MLQENATQNSDPGHQDLVKVLLEQANRPLLSCDNHTEHVCRIQENAQRWVLTVSTQVCRYPIPEHVVTVEGGVVRNVTAGRI